MRCTPNLSQCRCGIENSDVQNENVLGVLFTPPVVCSRLLSAVNDLTATNLKILSKCHSEQLGEEAASTGRPVL